jgi:hypothetical protein
MKKLLLLVCLLFASIIVNAGTTYYSDGSSAQTFYGNDGNSQTYYSNGMSSQTFGGNDGNSTTYYSNGFSAQHFN